jgi:hypothetical protein
VANRKVNPLEQRAFMISDGGIKQQSVLQDFTTQREWGAFSNGVNNDQ